MTAQVKVANDPSYRISERVLETAMQETIGCPLRGFAVQSGLCFKCKYYIRTYTDSHGVTYFVCSCGKI